MHRAPQELRTYFITSVAAQRRRVFQVEAGAQLLLDVLAQHKRLNRFALHAYVVMPDHMHLLLTPAPDVSLEKAVQYIKGGFSFRLQSKRDVWERGYNERQVRNRDAFKACRRYIEDNPVRAGLVASPSLFAYSSAALYADVDPCPDWLCRPILP